MVIPFPQDPATAITIKEMFGRRVSDKKGSKIWIVRSLDQS
jgi:hypothetical protein